MILIVTISNDPTAKYVAKKLEGRAIPYRLLETDLMWQQGSVCVRPSENGWTLNDGNGDISSEDVGVVWERRIPRSPVKAADKVAEQYANQEWRLFWEWWMDAIPERRILDPEWKIKRAVNKIAQLKIARDIGLQIPQTVVTNSLWEARRFIASQKVSAVAKTLGGFGRVIDPDKQISQVIYTSRITQEDLSDAEAIRWCPFILQEEIEKNHEIRVTMVGEELFACRIESQKSPRTNVDWRCYDFPNVPHSATTIPEEIEEKLLKMASMFDIHFASFDLAVTPRGQHIFFEMNPNSQWVWIEELTNLPITDALIDLLVEKGAGGIT